MKIKKIYTGVALAFLMAMSSGCEKEFLNINTDPNNPTVVTLPLLLSGTQGTMTTNLSHSTLGLSQPASAITRQLVNFRIGTYELITPSSFTNQWQGMFYNALANNEQLIRQGTESGDFAYVGIAKLQKAFMYSILVDLWGDVPYFQALQGSDNLAPAFDKDEEIYKNLFFLIDEGIADLKRPSLLRPAADDIIYNGNMLRWSKFGNTLKIKLYNQMRLAENVQPQVQALLMKQDSLMMGMADDFQFAFGASSQISPDNRHPGYTVEYAQAGRENHIDPYFFNLMKDRDDPRIPYYFYNQVTSSANINVDYQDDRFVSVRFGSNGPYARANDTDVRTLQGLYPVGGKFDDGQGGRATATSGTGSVPQRMLTYFEHKFNEAELNLVYSLGGERVAYEQGIRAAFAKVNNIATTTGAAPAIPAAEIDAYVADALARFDNATGINEKLEAIITEKYIANFGWGLSIYNDYRRTGFPVLPDPNTDTDPQTIRSGPFPLRFPYYAGELSANANAPAQPNIATQRIFWDIN